MTIGSRVVSAWARWWQYVVAVVVLLPVSTTPWRATLSSRPPTLDGWYIANAVFAVALAVGNVVYVLKHRNFRLVSPVIVALLLLYQVINAEGLFAETYYALSARTPNAFNAPLSGVDAVYFTISTATSTGMGDLHPITSTARLLVSGQMVTSLYLTVVAITTAVQRVFSRGTPEQQS